MRLPALLAAAALTLSPLAASAQAPLAGDWDGAIEAGGSKLRLTLHLASPATLDSPDQGAFCLPATPTRDGDLLTVTAPGGITLSGPITDTIYTAALTQFGRKLSVPFARRPAKAPAPEPVNLAADEREVSIGEHCHPLYGTFVAAKPGPAVLLLPGSGPTNRDGNSTLPGVRPASLKLIAQGLAGQGYASLRIDKRGAGMSSSAMASEQALRFEQYVDDAVAWTRWLKSQPGVSCVVLIGHSEGALVAAMAARKAPVCGVVEVSGSGETLGALLRKQARNNGMTGDALANFDKVLVRLEHGELAPEVPVSDPVLRPSIQPYAISEITLDPAAELKAVKAPVLIVHGDNDLLVNVDNAARLAAARPDAKLVIVPGMTHFLKLGPRDVAGQDKVRGDPNIPLAPGLIDAIAGFLATARPQ